MAAHPNNVAGRRMMKKYEKKMEPLGGGKGSLYTIALWHRVKLEQ